MQPQQVKDSPVSPQIKHADQAKVSLYALAAPTIKDVKHVIYHNVIKDNPVTEEDIKIAQAFHGPEMAVIKDKGTQQRPTQNCQDHVPKKSFKIHKNVHLFMDVMHLNKIAFIFNMHLPINHVLACYVHQKCQKLRTLWQD